MIVKVGQLFVWTLVFTLMLLIWNLAILEALRNAQLRNPGI